MEIADADDRLVCATRPLMDKGAQRQLGKERKAWGDRKSEKNAKMDSRFGISAEF